MGSKVKQFLGKIKSSTGQQKNTQEIPELRDLYKYIEDVRDALAATLKQAQASLERGEAYIKEETNFARALTSLSEANADPESESNSGAEGPNSSPRPNTNAPENGSASHGQLWEKHTSESGYLLAVGKFAEIYRDCTEMRHEHNGKLEEKVLQPLGALIKHDIQEVKQLKKRYDKAALEYSAILSKIEGLQKKQDLAKLFVAEKERVKLKRAYDECAYQLQGGCEEIRERLNFDVLDLLVVLLEEHKQLYGLAYSQFEDIHAYLTELTTWCKEERYIFEENKREREQLRVVSHENDHVERTRALVKCFSEYDLVDQLKLMTQQKNILPNIVSLHQHHQMPLPEFLQQMPGSNLAKEADLATVVEHLKTNFDELCKALLLRNKRDTVINLSEALAQLEEPKADKVEQQ
eukprot:TRINITY_DN2415_c0_g1_i1.p1 TRINITY_DN2415_c0_g1~~TRINITY_DN2415_c0_g1_i1.p1  ORF type:complete len:408 (+),score=171.73 TRINITY_DN2415_c0_g1_i1:80-1303(+)